jgi:ProP effector
MTITKKRLHAALTCLAERFPQTFVLEPYQPHHPLKVGIAADLAAHCPEFNRRQLSGALAVYVRRVMYLQSMIAGAARLDLDGHPVGTVTAEDAKHAAAKLARIRAARGTAPPAATTSKPVLRLPAFRQR